MIRPATHSTLALLLSAAPAAALTPDELWGAWQAQVAGLGAAFGTPGVTLAAQESRGDDGALTLTALAVSAPGLDPEALPPTFPIQSVTLRPEPDGAVLIDLGIPPEGLRAADATGELAVEDEGLQIVARDEPADGPGAIAYEVTAESLRVAFTVPDLYGGPDTDVAFEVAGLRLAFPGQIGADEEVAVELSTTGYAYAGSSPDAFTGDLGTQAARVLGDVSLRASATLPPVLFGGGPFETTMVQALRDGLAARIDVTAGAVSQQQWFDGFPFVYQTDAAAEPSSAFVAFDGTRAAFGVEAGGGTVTATSPQLPFPELDLGYGPMAVEVAAPLGPEPGDFTYRVSLAEVVVGEAAWAFVDPEGRLPRDPLRAVVDVGGRATIDAAGALAADAKGELPPTPSIDALEVRALELSGAGVTATGTASFTFDNASGVPVPTGTAEARVEGLDRLIDALVDMGAITDQDARDARLGLAFAFRAGDAPDTRVLTFEARPDGSMILNGVPFQP